MLLRKVRCFLEVARRGSFTAAAEHLRLSQPSLGSHIREIEERYSIKLFERHGRGSSLTEAARAFLPYAEALAAEADRTERALQTIGGDKSGRILLGVTPTSQATLAPELLQRCAAQRPGTELVLIPGLSHDLQRQVEARQLDAALFYGNPDRSSRLVSPLYSEDLYLIGKAGALGRRKTVAFADLPAFPLMLERRYQIFRVRIESLAAELGMSLNVRHEVEPVDAKRSLIRRYGVFAVAPLGLFLDEIDRGEMGAWRIVSPTLRFTLVLARRVGLSPVLSEALERWLQESVRAVANSRDLRWRVHG